MLLEAGSFASEKGRSEIGGQGIPKPPRPLTLASWFGNDLLRYGGNRTPAGG